MSLIDTRITSFINAIRTSFIGAEEVYSMGSCAHLVRILCLVFDQAEPVTTPDMKHALIRCEGRLYDIRGDVTEKYRAKGFLNDMRPYNLDQLVEELDDGFSLFECEEVFMQPARERWLDRKRDQLMSL